MACFLCKKEEATAFQDCLIVEHTVTREMLPGNQIRTRTTETDRGVQQVGLCPKCLKKQQKKHKNDYIKLRYYGIPLLAAAVLGVISSGNKSLETITGISALVILTGSLIAGEVIGRTRAAKDPVGPFFGIGCDTAGMMQEGTKALTVPVGEGLYPDFKTFTKRNPLLSDGASKKVYEEIIQTGNWKDHRPGSAMPGELAGNGAETAKQRAMAAALELAEIYRQHPEGFVTGDPKAEPVREIGRMLNEAGGKPLMLEAHGFFSAISPSIGPGLPRNLEFMWDGIGEWRG